MSPAAKYLSIRSFLVLDLIKKKSRNRGRERDVKTHVTHQSMTLGKSLT